MTQTAQIPKLPALLKEFNLQQERREELRAQIAEAEERLRVLNKQADKLCDDAISEVDVLIDALDAAGLVDYEIEPPRYGQIKKPYSITRIVKIEGFPVAVELDRNTGILLLDGKVQPSNQILINQL